MGYKATFLDFCGFTSPAANGSLLNWVPIAGVDYSGFIAAPGQATVPGAPTSVVATGGDSSAVLTWSAPASDGGSPITSYVATSSPATTPQTLASGGTFTGLTNGVAYTFTVHAVNAVGAGPESAASNSVTPAAPFTPPANTKLQSGDVTDMSNWFLKPGINPVLNAPDYNGNANSANTVTMSAGNSTHQGFTNNATGAWTTWGMALKAGSGIQYVALFRNDDAANYSVFDIIGGTVVSDHGTSVGTIHSLGNGYYWCSIVLGSSVQTFALCQFADTLPHINPNQNWNAAGTETVIAGPFSVN